MKLLKFFSYNNYLLEGLINHTLFFNNIYNFNDPFEGVFRYKVSSDFEKFKEFYLHHYKGQADRLDYYFKNKIELEKLINKAFNWRSNNNAVCCFSDKSKLKDILMWANYGENHKGICLTFESTILENSLTPKERENNGAVICKPSGPHPISYTYNYLDSNPLNKELDQISFLTTKFDKWKNEKEFRFISARAGNYSFNKNSLLQVTFGLRISNDSKEVIKKIVDERYGNIQFRQIKLQNDKFGLELIKT